MFFIKNSRTEYHILIGENASESIRLSAESLQDLIKRCTGTDIPISTVPHEPYISVGNTEEFKKTGVTVSDRELPGDGFKIVFRRGNIYLCGSTERGTVYAANDFAERFMGVRFLSVDETYTPFSDTLEMEEKDITEIPDFPSRSFFSWEVRRSPRFAANLRLITPLGCEREEAKKYGDGFLRDWNGNDMHAMGNILPKAKYYEKHPEWYNNNTGRPRTWFCLTNGLTDEDEDANDPDSCLATFANNVIEIIRNSPGAKYIMLGHEDSCGDVYCQCERCKRSRERNVTVSGYLMVFINAVARRVEQWRLENCPEREIKLVSFSYLETAIPPVYVQNEDGIHKPYIFLEREYWAPLKVRRGKIIPVNTKVVPEKNVVIFCAIIGACYLHEMTDEFCGWNQYYGFSLKAWKALGAEIMVWYYGVNFKQHLWWLPNRRTMRSHLGFFRQFDPLYLMMQGAPREGMFYQSILNAYLISKLMWNMDQDVDALTEEFNRLYFGEKSAAAVNTFIHKIEERYAELDAEYGGSYHSDISNCFPNSFLPQNFPYHFLTACIDELETAIENEDSEMIKTKLKRVSLHPLYMLAHNFHSYENADSKYMDLLEKYLLETGVLRVNEANISPEDLMKKLREKPQQ